MSFPMTRALRAYAALAVLPMVCLTAACHDTPTNPSSPMLASKVLGSVRVAPQAIVMAAGATQQLTLGAFTLDSTPITTFDTVRYTSSDSSRVKVSSSGLITAATGLRATTTLPVQVIAAVVHGGITRADTSYVAVVATGGTSPTFSLHDPTAATTKLPVNGTKTVVTAVTYFNGTSTVTMPSSAVPTHIRVLSNPTVAVTTSASQFYTYASSGTVTIQGTTMVFGTVLTDTVTYTLGNSLSGSIGLLTMGLKILQGVATSNEPFPPTTVFYLQPGGAMSLSNRVDTGTYTVGATCTATNGGVAPPPVTGIAAKFGFTNMYFTTAGTYGCDWTSNGFPNFPTDGSLHFSVVVQ